MGLLPVQGIVPESVRVGRETTMEKTSQVKISRPNVAGVVPRQRLFRLLDACGKRPVIWISGPAGSGKTTLVASYLDARKLPCLWYQVDEGDGDIASFFHYMGLAAKKVSPRYKKALPHLTPEYLIGISTFTRRFFEDLCRRLKPPSVIVLDNFQDASSSAFHEIISRAVEMIPEGITVIVLSREDPPRQMARVRANNRMSMVGWEQLRFTRQESFRLLDSQGGKPARKLQESLFEKTDGWAAGLVLLLEAVRRRGFKTVTPSGTPEAVFDYFSSEVFSSTEEEIRRFLLMTAFFPAMTARMAEQLTGNARSQQILHGLNQAHFFTDLRPLPEPVFQYHRLFREFLMTRAKHYFRPGEVADLSLRTAAILQAEGRIEDAAALLIEAEAAAPLTGLIMAHAHALVGQGRSQTLEAWIKGLPETLIHETPWLLYWLGICRMPFSPDESRVLFEKAFQKFEQCRDDAGLLLSWSAAINSMFYGWDQYRKMDPLIAWLKKRMARKRSFPSPEIEAVVSVAMATAVLSRRGSPSEFREWHERALDLTLHAGDVNLRLQACVGGVQFYILSGDFAKARIVSEDMAEAAKSAGVSPLMKAMCSAIEPFIDSISTESDGRLKSVAECLAETEEIGIHMFDHLLFAVAVMASLNAGDLRAGGEYLEKMKAALEGPKCFGLFHYHILAAWYHLLKGDTAAAMVHAEEALDFYAKTGAFLPEVDFSAHHALAQIAHEMKDYPKVRRHLLIAGEMAAKTESSNLRYMHLMAEAWLALETGKAKEGLVHLRRAMELGRSRGYISMFWWWNPKMMSRLCSTALENDIETGYVRGLVSARGLIPPQGIGPESWPYPLKIHALGQFQVMRNGEILDFPVKAQKKPLEMLKALIALGGSDISSKRLADILWPDAEGDSAHKSFEVTLLRLRRLLGMDDAVLLRGGTVSLNPRQCWVDVRAFEHCTDGALREWKKIGVRPRDGEAAGAVRLSEMALQLYQGPLMPNDTEMECTIAMREKSRNRALRHVSSLGSYWEAAGRPDNAIECYRRGLEIDPVEEEFYRRLMDCHYNLGQKGNALRAYEQCSSMMSSILGIGPSGKTQELFDRIRRGR